MHSKELVVAHGSLGGVGAVLRRGAQHGEDLEAEGLGFRVLGFRVLGFRV